MGSKRALIASVAHGADTILQIARGNRILNALPEAALEKVVQDTTLTELEQGRSLYREDSPVKSLYFPLKAVVAILERADYRRDAVMARVGCEGALGISVAMGVSRPLGRKIVQEPGPAIAIATTRFQDLLNREEALSQVMRRYVYAFLREVLQTGACNRLHDVRQCCARWLLLAHDRAGEDEFHVTQDVLAENLGTRRRSINRCLAGLREEGVVHYVYRKIRILDRALLESCACPCYRVIRDAHEIVRA